LIGLRQLQRLLCCAPCHGTYLGCGPTACIHPHLMHVARLDQSFPSAEMQPENGHPLVHGAE